MDTQIPTEFVAFVEWSRSLQRYAPCRVQVNPWTFENIYLAVSDPRMPWEISSTAIFGIAFTGVEIDESVPVGILRMPDVPDEEG